MSEFKGLFIAIPCYGGDIRMEAHATISNLRSALAWSKAKSQEYAMSMCDIVDARNCMLTFWYDDRTEYSHLLMYDNDMSVPPSLILEMLKMDKPITGVFYAKRETPQGDDPWKYIIGRPCDGPIQPIDEKGFQKVKYVGGGALLIQRDAITEMLKKLPEINDCTDPGAHGAAGITRIIRAFDKMKHADGYWLSEDYSFCERWRLCGGEIYAAVNHPIGHIGKFNYCANPADWLGLNKPEAKAA